MRIAFACSMVALAAGCGGAAAPVHGPYTGTTQRFYVTGLALPQQRSEYAADLDDDGRVENGLGAIEGLIASQYAHNQHIDEILAADRAPMILELTTDDPTLRRDDSVGLRWLGGGVAAADQIGAVLRDGNVTSNPVTPTATPAQATVRLPLYAAADPSRLSLDRYQIELAPDGAGGFVGQLNGAIVAADVFDEMGPQLIQMIRNTKQPSFIRWFDANRDGTITLAELPTQPFVTYAATPDARVGVPKGAPDDALSIGFMFTLAPCGDNACTRPTPAPSCFDRVRNGDESDVDCGGSCGECPGGSACTNASDCDAHACDGGVCRAPSCSDGVRDGFEIDVDCGDGCAPCVEGAHCSDDVDCQSGHCGNIGGKGVCVG